MGGFPSFSLNLNIGHPSGGMNSWFLYEFMVCSMGSISANIADISEKLIMPCRSWCWGVGQPRAAHEYHCALVGIISRIGYRADCRCCCLLCRVFLLGKS